MYNFSQNVMEHSTFAFFKFDEWNNKEKYTTIGKI